MAKRSESKSNVAVWFLAVGVFLAAAAGVTVFLSYWLQPPVVAISNLKYLQLLRTAVSSQNAEHVKKIEGAVRTLKERGELSEPEWEHFQSIIAKALGGDWQAADRACQSWENAQANRVRDPRDAHESSHKHVHGARDRHQKEDKPAGR